MLNKESICKRIELCIKYLVHLLTDKSELARGGIRQYPEIPHQPRYQGRTLDVLQLIWLIDMPFPFTLPTTSSFSFSTYFGSDSHPSLPLSASTYRGVLRDALKRHKRLPPPEQSSHLSTVLLALNNYVPYLSAVDSGLGSQAVAGEELDVVLKSTPMLEWRPTLSDASIPGREKGRLKIQSLEYEIYFVLSSLAYTYTLLSRSSLHPLYSSATSSVNTLFLAAVSQLGIGGRASSLTFLGSRA